VGWNQLEGRTAINSELMPHDDNSNGGDDNATDELLLELDDSLVREGMLANADEIQIPVTTGWDPRTIETDYLNRGTFDEVYTDLFPRIYNHVTFEISRLGMKAELAGDVLQIASRKAHDNWDSYTQGTYALAWFKKIVTNTCFNLRRQEWTRENRLVLVNDLALLLDNAGFRSPSAEKMAIERIREEELRALFDRLPDPFRAATKAVVLDGMRTDEAAELLSIPPATVLTRVHRGRARLRSMITEQREKDSEI
jgi:RNA polymerase sigma-70 factor (ECF subfamily)